ncbi:MAG TPA: hypothetical protein VFT27_11345 [Actinomycetota bacterium]|nr:hypothetical protein [Actinomycetota bacterium]
MDRHLDINEAVKAASKVLPSNPDYEGYLQGLLARVSPEDRQTLALEGLSTLATRRRRHRARNARREAPAKGTG